jgi:hypothetical protein
MLQGKIAHKRPGVAKIREIARDILIQRVGVMRFR